MGRDSWTFRLSAALIAATATWAAAEGQAPAMNQSDQASAAGSPGTTGVAALDDRLSHSQLQDRMALEVLPYEKAPVHVELESDPANALKASAYPPIAKPVHRSPDTNTQALAPLAQ